MPIGTAGREVHSIVSSGKFAPKFVSLCVKNKQIHILGGGGGPPYLMTYFISQNPFHPGLKQTTPPTKHLPRANNKV
jgi:hypothetical protein